MPLYEYLCDDCGHQFEHIQKFSDALVEKCPKCGGRVHKLQSAPAFHLKGTGWYATDYAKKDPSTPAEKSESGTKDSKEASSETKDSKETSSGTKDAAAKTEKTEKSSSASESKSTTPSKDKSA